MNFTLRLLIRTVATATLLLVACFIPLRAQSDSGPPTTTESERLFAPRLINHCKLSYSGNLVGMMRRFNDHHYTFLIIDLTTGKSRSMLVANDAALQDFWWKGDDLVLVKVWGPDGKVFRVLDPATGKSRSLDSLRSRGKMELIDTLPGHPSEIIFHEVGDSDAKLGSLLRIDLRADKCSTATEDKKGGVLNWVTTADGIAVAAWGIYNQAYFYQTRPSAEASWVRHVGPQHEFPEVIPLGMSPDQHSVLALDYREQKDRGALAAIDLRTGEAVELASSAQQQITDLVSWGAGNQIAGVIFDNDPEANRFLIPDAEAAVNWLDGKLPGMSHAFRSFSGDGTRAIVEVWSSKNPGMYCLVDLPGKRISVLSPVNPEAENLGLAGSVGFQFTARDGQPLHGRVTLPRGAGPKPPMVLLVNLHRMKSCTADTFDPAAEFFARQGFAAVRVDHRGTNGYGRSFTTSANYHIHDLVVNDLRDAMAHLENTGLVDTHRAAVYGVDTGGWIAFHLAAIPGLFRVLLNDCTPLELNLLHIGAFTNLGNKPLNVASATTHSGEAKKYEVANNPLKFAAALPIPSLHAYTPGHAVKKLKAAMKKSPQPHAFFIPAPAHETGLEWVEWREEAKRFEAMVAFLKRHL